MIAGSWFSSKERRGEELIPAGLLMPAGLVDLDGLPRWLGVTAWGLMSYPDSED
ncbi:MAG TPA: hypothetical protein VFO20_03105 [Propionibacteriaceae bacterium]|nr:hypothetical protein [Propionibacteriaceae bacterium]